MENRKEQTDAKYRQKFSELGIEDFEYIRFESKERILFRCKKCGTEFAKGNDLFKGKQKRLICPNCKPKRKCDSEYVDEVLAYYAEGHSNAETCEKFGVSKDQVKNWAKQRGVHSGRSRSDICRENGSHSSKHGNKKQIEQAKNNLIERLRQKGFEYVCGYENGNSAISVVHSECGAMFERRAMNFRKYKIYCPVCKERQSEENKRIKIEQIKERKKEKEKQKALRAIINPLGLSPYQLEREQRLDLKHVCKCCGQEYTVREYMKSCGLTLYSDVGFCSQTCKTNFAKTKAKLRPRKKHSSNHYARARKLGLPREKGITLPKLIERDGLFCAICGCVCIYGGDPKSDLYPSIDHIIPLNAGLVDGKGGHVWSNVQIAHRICNSNKRDYIGKEWKNAV